MSLANRPAAGLYAAAWALCGLGIAALFIGLTSDPPLRGTLVMGALVALILGLAAAAGQQVIARKARPADKYHGPAPLILFFLQFALVNAISLVILVLGAPLDDSPLGFLLAAIVLLTGYIVVVWLFVVRTGALSWREIIRAQPLNASRAAFDICIGGATMFGAAIVAGILGTIVANLLGTQAPNVVPAPTTGVDIFMIALGAGILVPIGEELFFRGFTLTAWLRDLGERSALIRATVFFALVHIVTLSSDTFIGGVKQAILVLAVIGPIGFALGWLYLRRGLIASIGGHAAFNLFSILVMVLAQYLPGPGTSG
ncbi:MAG: type II CAAX endopeptidase family protein [Chloroflexota bacterium]